MTDLEKIKRASQALVEVLETVDPKSLGIKALDKLSQLQYLCKRTLLEMTTDLD